MGLYDAVNSVGVRSHYKATLLALPMLRKASGRGLIVNTNSAGCLFYLLNVPYGIGECLSVPPLYTPPRPSLAVCAGSPLPNERAH